MAPERDFDAGAEPPGHGADLAQDLELETVLAAMAGGDPFVGDVSRAALGRGAENDAAAVLYRQEVLRDSLANPATVRELYAFATQTIAQERRLFWAFNSRQASTVLYGAVESLQLLCDALKRLRGLADQHGPAFTSRGFTTLFEALRRELDDEYLALLRDDLARLRFRSGVLLGAALGDGNQGTDYTLLRTAAAHSTWLQRLLRRAPDGLTFAIAERDEAGARALSDLRDRGLNLVANAAAQSAEHLVGFFTLLRAELAFYVGCLNLHDALSRLGAPVALPVPERPQTRTLHFTELYDVALALTSGRRPAGNTLDLSGANLVVVTGANQGGKSTFLRSLGLAQLMMQAGMFVGAGAFRGALATSLHTHYRREEDSSMRQGKLDEELGRMSAIADAVGADATVLFSESFAATNDREGSEIARQIVSALVERRVRVFMVTHLLEFARTLAAGAGGDIRFLRAERLENGTRTFRMMPGAPLETSFAEDVHREVFGEGDAP